MTFVDRHLRQRTALIVAVVLLALVPSACSDDDDGSHAIAPLAWDEALSLLDTEQQEFARNFARSVPTSIPPHAVAISVMLRDDPIRDGVRTYPVEPDALVRVEIVPLNGGPNNDLDLTLVCLRNARQVACRPESSIQRSVLPPRSGALLATALDAEVGDRLDYLIIIAGDYGVRFFPTSQHVTVGAGLPPRAPEATLEAPRSRPIRTPGVECDSVTFLESGSPGERAPSVQRVPRAVDVVVQTCDERGETLHLVAIGDRQRVLEPAGELWNQPIRMTGDTVRASLPVESLHGLTDLQIAVLRWVDQDAPEGRHSRRAVWFSRAIRYGDERIEPPTPSPPSPPGRAGP